MKTKVYARPYKPVFTVGRAFLVLLIGLSVLTVYQLYSRQPTYQLLVENRPTGWGYTILRNGVPFIDQPTVPGQAGVRGFGTETQARRVGLYVLAKLRTQPGLPALSPDEVQRLTATP